MIENRETLSKFELLRQDDSDALKFISYDAKYDFKDIDIKIAYTTADYVATVVVLISDISHVTTISQLRANDNYTKAWCSPQFPMS